MESLGWNRSPESEYGVRAHRTRAYLGFGLLIGSVYLLARHTFS